MKNTFISKALGAYFPFLYHKISNKLFAAMYILS